MRLWGPAIGATWSKWEVYIRESCSETRQFATRHTKDDGMGNSERAMTKHQASLLKPAKRKNPSCNTETARKMPKSVNMD